LFLQAAERLTEAAGIRNPFFHPPSIYTTADLVLTLGIILFLWVNRNRLFRVKGDEVTPRQYERLTHRLDGLERTIAEDRVHREARFDQVDEALKQRALDDFEFRRSVLDTEEAQIRTMKLTHAATQATARKVEYLLQRIGDNGAINETPKGEGG
jgi:hypothetical protein